jgi:hypothetical protein
LWAILPKPLKDIIRYLKSIFIRFIRWLINLFRFIRIQKPISFILGPQWKANLDIIEIDVTYHCNLSCFSCDRVCGQAPSDERMSIEQIKKFVRQSVDNNKKWKRITLLGGEPTGHPDIIEILNILLNYKKKHSSETEIQLVSNGCGADVEKVLMKLPKGILIKNSKKSSSLQKEFDAMTVAPADRPVYIMADYGNACDIPHKCGIALTINGYYPCAPAGAIDRVFGFNMGHKEIIKSAQAQDELKKYCRYCGHFLCFNRVNLNYNSKTWQKALVEYRQKKPQLDRY